jgi:hypothetical protein
LPYHLFIILKQLKFFTMKKQSFLQMLMGMSMLASIVLGFTSCQQDEAVGTSNTPISMRTSPPDVPALIEVPAGHEVSHHTYAEGVQVYVSTETSPGVYAWVFREPIADLYANAGFNGQVGTHYAGPSWESNSGSKVVGARVNGITVDPDAIPWLLLRAVSSSGPGVYDGTSFIQRVNTVGGKAPATGAHAGNVGEELHVYYTAEYYFYKPV